ncbi:MAG: hypothetical protein PHO74_02170 [Weeksellaceae bacterium]|jgi:hypothetical protein|nr:hypothetical protein [Weeksellaceae bacterium]
MGILTDFWFGLGYFFIWTFDYILVPIANSFDWILFFIGLGLIVWWLYKLAQFGDKEDREYKGW